VDISAEITAVINIIKNKTKNLLQKIYASAR
jgi:hypothetical protein